MAARRDTQHPSSVLPICLVGGIYVPRTLVALWYQLLYDLLLVAGHV